MGVFFFFLIFFLLLMDRCTDRWLYGKEVFAEGTGFKDWAGAPPSDIQVRGQHMCMLFVIDHCKRNEILEDRRYDDYTPLLVLRLENFFMKWNL